MQDIYDMDEQQIDAAPDDQDGDGQRRERSTIEFPYMDLEMAVSVARGVNEYGGASLGCEHDQLASQLGISASSSGYRTRLAAARIFDLVTSERGSSVVKLTDLGARVVDPRQERDARAEAFLRVPLYQRVFENHRGQQLPPTAALQRELEGLGVAAKQAERARQVLERSAEAAGYFEGGRDRLIRPKPQHPNIDSRPGNGGGGDGEGGGEAPKIDPLIQALLAHLPPPKTVWPQAERQAWIKLLEGSLSFIYKDGTDGARSEPADPDRAKAMFK